MLEFLPNLIKYSKLDKPLDIKRFLIFHTRIYSLKDINQPIFQSMWAVINQALSAIPQNSKNTSILQVPNILLTI